METKVQFNTYSRIFTRLSDALRIVLALTSEPWVAEEAEFFPRLGRIPRHGGTTVSSSKELLRAWSSPRRAKVSLLSKLKATQEKRKLLLHCAYIKWQRGHFFGRSDCVRSWSANIRPFHMCVCYCNSGLPPGFCSVQLGRPCSAVRRYSTSNSRGWIRCRSKRV